MQDPSSGPQRGELYGAAGRWQVAGGSQQLCTGPDSRLGTENHTK